MLTLQQILESDSVSSLVAKVNLNFQQIAVSGGGPQGLPGEQGIPGLPGRQGPIGPTGVRGATGSVVGIIPFASQTGGSTGPTGSAGPWNTYSYEYLNNIIGTGTSQIGNIWIDHYNDGFWQYLNAPNGTGNYLGTQYTNSPYSNPYAGTAPPDGTGYFSAAGWYFYPLKNTGGGGSVGDVWTNDVTTYQTAPPFATGPFDDPSPLTVKNARLLSKYGTVWISSGNAVDNTGAVDSSNLTTPNLYDWGTNAPASQAQPARYNSGVDRLYFKQSIDTLPYRSNINAMSYTDASNTPAGNPANDSSTYPNWGFGPIEGPPYWVKPLYSPTIDYFSPLQYYTERRENSSNYGPNTSFGTLGLYMYTAKEPGKDVNTVDYRKSLWSYSTRTSIAPNGNTGAGPITEDDTFNIGEMLFDVRKLTTSNQFVCSLPQDLYLSADHIAGSVFNEAIGGLGYTVTQGYVSAINGKSLTGIDVSNILNYFNYGSLTGTAGNKTRSSWYGSGAMYKPSNWDTFDSGDPGNIVDTHISDSMYRFAGMRERAKKSYNSSETYFLNELTFYTSQFKYTGENANVSSNEVNLKTNQHNSLPGFYLSPFRNFGIGTFTKDDSGVFEPIARLHAHAFVRGTQFDGGAIKDTVDNRSYTNPYVSRYTLQPWLAYPANTYKGGALTIEDTTSTYLDFYLGHVNPTQNEYSNSLTSTPNPNTRATNILDTSIRRETWNELSGPGQAAIMRLGVSPVSHNPTGSDFTLGQDAPSIKYDFQIALSPLNPFSGYPNWDFRSPVGIGIQNLYPRARFHLFGKNLQNEGELGNEPYTPGLAAAAGTSATNGYYPSANYSVGQVVIDKIESTYQYNVGWKEYPYEAYGVVGITGATGPTAATGISGSSNAATFPNWDKANPTRNVIPWQPQTRNLSAWSLTGSAQGLGQVYMHGEKYRNLFNPGSYIGFNLFRDLLNVGDNLDETRWMTGTCGDNGGSAIITSTSGDMAFVNIKSGRDGGNNYRPWEQRGLSTRDVLNNVSLILTSKGDMGLGAEPGLDYNAYPSRERSSLGHVHYVPVSGDARTGIITYRGTMGTGTGTNKPYGLVNYLGLTSTYVETMSVSSAAQINASTTQFDYIRFELGAEKFYGKNSRSSLAAGYGYPLNMDVAITGADVQNYILLDPAYPGVLDRLILASDEEGRIWYITIGDNGSTAPFVDPRPYILGVTLPHPTEFNFDSGLPWAQVGFTAPAGACAGILKPASNWVYDDTLIYSWGLPNTNFVNEAIGLANMRLNNFIAGEGMSPATGDKSQSWVAQQVKQARQRSPKLIMSFLEGDNTTIPGTKALNTSETIGTNRPISGTGAYRKVSTVIASAQNESSLREYWIPKSDNTGGTFMVWTDHYGNKEYQTGFDTNTVATSRFYLEEVIALEFVPSYTGTTAGNEYISGTGGTGESSNSDGRTEYDYPLHVKYYNSLMGVPKYGLTGATANAFTPAQWGRKVDLFGQSIGSTGPTTQYVYDEHTPNYVQSSQPAAVTCQGTGLYPILSPTQNTPVWVEIASSGDPLQIIAEGDAYFQLIPLPLWGDNGNCFCNIQLYRETVIGSTATDQLIGNSVQVGWDPGTNNYRTNVPWTLSCIDDVPAGVYKYYVIVTSRGTFNPSNYDRGVIFGVPAAPGIERPGGPIITVTELNSTVDVTGTGTYVNAGATGLSLLRNVDKYYNLVQNSTNWDNGWESDGEFRNETSQFRFKRINSDMALVDFNMTIEVKNPNLFTGVSNPSDWGQSLIDNGSPRWTQYIRLAYIPGRDLNDNNYFMKLFGNSLSFMNWSSYNQWYPGTAITSDPNLITGDALSNTGGPNYTMNTSYDPSHTQNIVWNGNFYDATMSVADSPNSRVLGNYYAHSTVPGTYPEPPTSGMGISPFYGTSFYNANISKMLVWVDPTAAYPTPSKGVVFGTYMGKAYSILGNDYLSKVRNCTWRVVPRIGTWSGDGVDLDGPTNVKNNSFALEIMFDKPILHIDTPFAKHNFSSVADGDPCFPYQHLTVSGQAMVRYSDSTNTKFAGPTTILEGIIDGPTPEPGPVLRQLNDTVGDGLVAYIYQPGDPGYDPNVQHGLIVYESWLDDGGTKWWMPNQLGNFGFIGATGTALGSGLDNTNKILAAYPTQQSAALYVRALMGPSYSLPSQKELELILENAYVGSIPAFNNGLGWANSGGANNTAYWSSTEYTSTTAWRTVLSADTTGPIAKTGFLYLIGVKYF